MAGLLMQRLLIRCWPAAAAQLNSIKSFGIQQAGAPAPAPVAQPAATPSPVAAPEEASAPAPAAGQVSAASMDTAPTTAPINTTTPTAPTTGTVTEKLNITVYSALATLQLYASNLTEVTSPSTVWQESGLCPSGAPLGGMVGRAYHAWVRMRVCLLAGQRLPVFAFLPYGGR